MKSLLRACLLLVAAVFLAAAQNTAASPAKAAPLTLQEIYDYFSDPDLAPVIPKILEAVERNGVAFSLDQKALERLLDAAHKGNQTDQLTASLILQILRACADCSSRYFGPLTKDELLALLRREMPPRTLFEETRLRGVKDVPKTQAIIDELRANGATPELIDLVVPDDELEIQTPSGYSRFDLRRASEYSRYAAVGELHLHLDVQGQVEVVFVNNALFYRPVMDPVKNMPLGQAGDVGSTYAAPAPAAEPPKVNDQPGYGLESVTRTNDKRNGITSLMEKGKSLGKGAKGIPTVEFAANVAAGRGGFRIIIDEPDKKQAHTYDIRLRWNPPGGAKQ